jgi:phosphoenolpyruvate carboxykinase (GTP)
MQSNPNAMLTATRNSIFTNCALTPDGDVWWEGATASKPESLVDWLGRPWTPDCGRKAAHPNARFTAPAGQCPVIAPEWESPQGVPIDAILFGGRRASVVPLAIEAFDWQHGTFLGATTSSETTAAAAGKVGQLRRDPMAMLPFCGYHMGDYFAHWLRMGETAGARLPKIYYVNWFQQDSHGRFLWPGFGDNSRILKWIFERCDGRGGARETAIGRVPHPGDLDLAGLDIPPESIARLLHVDLNAWMAEVPSIREHFARFGDRLPQGMKDELAGLEERLEQAALRAA